MEWVRWHQDVLLMRNNGRINPEMSNQIADGIQRMDLNNPSRPYSTMSQMPDAPYQSPFPKLQNPPPNVPPSDEELETRLENARQPVLNSNDPEMQLAWAQDALMYVGTCADEAERLAALKPQQARSSTPRIEHQLKTDAMNIVTFLADQSHPRAEFLRGMWLEWGRYGQAEDRKEAFRCYMRAADRGYARAEYRIGMFYEASQDHVKALRHYNKGIEAGDAASCYRMGMITIRGQLGQQINLPKAIDLIRRSAEGADENAAQGAYVYGMLLARQLPQFDIPENVLEYNEHLAKQNIEKAAYMKFAKAQAKMGSMYELGSFGCEFNPALSMHYNALASKQGEADADMALSKWFLVGAEGLFPKNEELAFAYAERAAATGLPTAEFALGYFNEIGMHVPVNLERAKEWYTKAAGHKNADAQARLDGLAKKQVLSKSDHENVAVNRIKSQRGSMRGQRPERFKPMQAPQMGIVQESPYDTSGPSRNSSRTPYPEDNGPPQINYVRPPSAAPYPMDDGPSGQHGTPRLGSVPPPQGGGFISSSQYRPAPSPYQGEMRPSSAFQLNPQLNPENRSNSVAAVPQRHYGGLAPASPGPGLRPSTAQPYDMRQSSAPSYGLHPNDPRARPNMGNRVASGPAGMQNPPGRPGSGPPGPGHPPHPQTFSSGAPSPLNPSRVDLGFSAPYEERPVAVDPTWREKPPRRARGGSDHSSARMDSTQSLPNFDQQPHSRPASRTPDPNRKASAPPSKDAASSTAKPNPPKPPGKGPKTFEEMGVPAQPQDKDCVRFDLLKAQSSTRLIRAQVVM